MRLWGWVIVGTVRAVIRRSMSLKSLEHRERPERRGVIYLTLPPLAAPRDHNMRCLVLEFPLFDDGPNPHMWTPKLFRSPSRFPVPVPLGTRRDVPFLTPRGLEHGRGGSLIPASASLVLHELLRGGVPHEPSSVF